MKCMIRKLIKEYVIWRLQLNVRKTKCMAKGDTSRNLKLEGGKKHVKEYKYFGNNNNKYWNS